MIEIIPAIDIIEGRCVRLSQGDYNKKSVYDAAPLDMAKEFEDAGVKRLHLVDLDGAKSSSPRNLKTLETIATHTSLKIEWGGGIKSASALTSVFDVGAAYAICGSIAIKEPESFKSWLSLFGSDRIILGADINGRNIAINGWLESSSTTIDDILADMAPCKLSQVICTDISKDGMLQGPSFELYRELQSDYPQIIFTVSGGISSLSDIERLNDMNLQRVIVGKAIYEGKITIKEIEQWILNA
jgi:phosphoribosylformimino-5-aminoimidazole carboxamide ribotide isomerase